MQTGTYSDSVFLKLSGRIVWAPNNFMRGTWATEYGSDKKKLNKDGENFKVVQFYLAVPKEEGRDTGEGKLGAFFNGVKKEIAQVFPDGPPEGFARKMLDGDGTKENEKGEVEELSNRVGYKGRYVLKLNSGDRSVDFYNLSDGGGMAAIENEGIRNGDYVSVLIRVVARRGTNPGMFFSPTKVLLIRKGQAISSGPSADEAFGRAPVTPDWIDKEMDALGEEELSPEGHAFKESVNKKVEQRDGNPKGEVWGRHADAQSSNAPLAAPGGQAPPPAFDANERLPF